ncbi:MAG: hypothetical protein KatS3mg009_2754 [Acidimicrobiia bacterium]|nr:MAG: hypothetical protein KatS3mg009_2754 [Acidimicrobiia bacterium]
MMLPTNTTNITGLRAWTRGSSFTNASTAARRTTAGSKRARPGDAFRTWVVGGVVAVSIGRLLGAEVFGDGPECEGREVGQPGRRPR